MQQPNTLMVGTDAHSQKKKKKSSEIVIGHDHVDFSRAGSNPANLDFWFHFFLFLGQLMQRT
jgi:hypothetical protein